MLRLPGKIAVAAAGLALAVSLFAVQASMPFEPELSISLSHPAPAANSNVTSVTHLPADNHVMVFWAHFLPVEWDVAPGTEVPIGDVVAQATMSVDVDCDDTIQTFGPFNLTNEEVDPGLIARWRGQITDWWFLVINLDREEDDNGKGAEIGWNMNASMTGFTEFHTRCAPMTFSITFFGQSSPSDAVVLTNPSEEGAYTWQGFYISTGAEHTTNRTVEVCVGLSCPTPTPTPTPTPSPMPCEPPPPWPVPPGDSDCDGFTDAAEAFIGTDPFAACGPNAWPPDFNDDGLVNVLDFIVLSAHFGTQSGDPGYSQRFDLNTDGFINVLDFIILSAFFGHECYDPSPPTPTPTPTPTPSPCEPPPPWPVPPGDSDCDGFTDAAEAFIGTDPFAACGPNAWPPDFNDDGLVNVLDFIVLSANFGTQSGDPGYSQRFDLNTDGFINVLDFIILSAFFGHECYDP